MRPEPSVGLPGPARELVDAVLRRPLRDALAAPRVVKGLHEVGEQPLPPSVEPPERALFVAARAYAVRSGSATAASR